MRLDVPTSNSNYGIHEILGEISPRGKEFNMIEKIGGGNLAKYAAAVGVGVAVALPTFKFFQGFYNPDGFYGNDSGEQVHDNDELVSGEDFDDFDDDFAEENGEEEG